MPAVLAAVAVGGCGTAVEHSAPDRARDAVVSFLRDCGEGQWISASRVVSPSARESWVTEGRPALRCAEALGVDPTAFATASDDDPARMRDAFAAARITRVRIRGDYATVAVRLAGVPGEADLENGGVGDYTLSTMPKE